MRITTKKIQRRQKYRLGICPSDTEVPFPLSDESQKTKVQAVSVAPAGTVEILDDPLTPR
jgi:hypothetical protein